MVLAAYTSRDEQEELFRTYRERGYLFFRNWKRRPPHRRFLNRSSVNAFHSRQVPDAAMDRSRSGLPEWNRGGGARALGARGGRSSGERSRMTRNSKKTADLISNELSTIETTG